jgi:hypothetical protein
MLSSPIYYLKKMDKNPLEIETYDIFALFYLKFLPNSLLYLLWYIVW